MSILVAEIEEFARDQVKKGHCRDIKQAEREIAAKLAEMDLDRNLARGIADIETGKYSVVDEKWSSDYMKRLENKLLSTKK